MTDDAADAGHPRRRSIRLDPDEAWGTLAAAHTGIFTSLRHDGTPVALPLWFVVADRTIWLSTPATSKKVARVRRRPRTSFLVESGLRWAELRAVHLTCTATVVEDDTVRWVDEQKRHKYANYQSDRSAMPARTRDYYGAARVAIRLDPDERILSWDNARLGVR